MNFEAWKSVQLGEIATFYNGRAYKNTEFKSVGTPIVRIQNLTGEGKTVFSDLKLEENKYIDFGDLIYAWSATFGAYIWKGKRSIYHYHIWKIACNAKLLDKSFFYYQLNHVSQALKDGGNGTLFDHITKSFIENFIVNIPNLEIQTRIGAILSSLDAKIELNRQTNATLEAMAQTLFQEMCSLESEAGKLSDMAQLNPKLSLKKGCISKYIEMKDLSEKSASIANYIEREFTAGSKFQNEDTLFARITPCLENGKTGFVNFLSNDEIAWGSTEFIVLRGKDSVSPYYIYCLSRSERFRTFAIQSMVGSSGRQRVVESILLDFDLSN
jgi:restriction endonuclease S subunit